MMARCRQLSLATLANIGMMSSTARSLCHRKAMLLTEHVGAHGDVGATRRRSERPQHSMAVFRPFGRGRGKDVREDSCAARGWLNFLICCRNLVKPAAARASCHAFVGQTRSPQREAGCVAWPQLMCSRPSTPLPQTLTVMPRMT